jgi:hypothetical protein
MHRIVYYTVIAKLLFLIINFTSGTFLRPVHNIYIYIIYNLLNQMLSIFNFTSIIPFLTFYIVYAMLRTM